MINIPIDSINQIRNLLEKAKSVLIVTGTKPDMDAISATLSLYLALSSTGKQVTVASPSQITVEFNRLVGVDKIIQTVNGSTGKNLIISFPYQEGSIEKVSYNIDNNIFNLVIEPREGYKLITPDDIKYSHSGGVTDVIFAINTSKLPDLENIYSENQTLFNSSPVINIDTSPENTQYGKVNIIETNMSSTSELIISLFSQLGINLDQNISSNLLAGIIYGSKNFTSPKTNAATFESAAICLRNGAKKINETIVNIPLTNSIPQTQDKQPKPVQFSVPFSKTSKPLSFKPQGKQTFNQFPPKNKAVPFSPKPNQVQQQSQQQNDKSAQTPSDWLKPKIYKGSTLL
ncbi:hypothetical protein COX23_00685 [Candidatus Gottesmanbacteria bacterium CG23_combo_of_CG06-09_8_20_14_all_37_19]|nr:MAG: hypothetical protein COX23_00685 [Candidatus Gottesmanbacteria bacterium CG23_combo_of_CG06-09_8_20_14_all_37_19]